MNTFVSIDRQEPQISFDTQIGTHIPSGMVLDFDVELYRVFARRERAEHLVGDARIHIGARGALKAMFGIGGAYNRFDEITKVTFSDNLDTTNARLRHESKHYFDHQNGILDGELYTVAANLGVFANKMATFFTYGNALRHLIEWSPPADWEVPASLTACAVATIGGLAYYLKPDELRARKVAKLHSDIAPLRLCPASECR